MLPLAVKMVAQTAVEKICDQICHVIYQIQMKMGWKTQICAYFNALKNDNDTSD